MFESLDLLVVGVPSSEDVLLATALTDHLTEIMTRDIKTGKYDFDIVSRRQSIFGSAVLSRSKKWCGVSFIPVLLTMSSFLHLKFSMSVGKLLG